MSERGGRTLQQSVTAAFRRNFPIPKRETPRVP